MSEAEEELENIPPEELDWLRRFFWYRGLNGIEQTLSGSNSEGADRVERRPESLAVTMAIRIAGPNASHEDYRQAAMIVLQTINALFAQRRWLLNCAREQANSTMEAEDLTQETLRRALETIHRDAKKWERNRDGDATSRIKGWLKTILNHLIIDEIRKTREIVSLDMLLPDGRPLSEVLNTKHHLIEDWLDLRSNLEIIDRTLDFLAEAETNPANYKLRMYDARIARTLWFDESKVEEIAKGEHISLSTVNAAEKRVRNQLFVWFETSESTKNI